jgi:membrane protease YdiL (CAAX protease family)
MTQTNSPPPRTGSKNWRLGLRVLLGFILLYTAILIVNLIMGVGPNLLMRWMEVTPNVRAFLGSTLTYGVRIAALCLLPALALRKALNTSPWGIFFPLNRGWWKDLLFGFWWITAVLSLFFFLEVKAGWLIIEGWNWQSMSMGTWLRVAWVGLLVNISVAVGEEATFRGYLLTGFKSAFGKWAGLILMTIIFGSFHLPAYAEAGMQSGTLTLAILLASAFGLMFGLIYLRTQSLWLPIALHFAWNFIENDLFNLSADSTNPNLIGALTRLHSPLTMTEMGLGNVVVIETLAFALIGLGLWLWLRHRPPASP